MSERFARVMKFALLLTVILAMVGVSLGRVTAQSAFKESPFLADAVKSGKIPALADRLPKSPAVVTPLVEQGKYGGTLRIGFTGDNPGWGGMWYMVGWENLVIWKPDFSGVVPNIAESYEVSSDVTEYTFKLRQGMKWSDGKPFTADDIMFYIEDVLFDKELSKNGPITDWLPQDGRDDFKATKVDETTFKFKFSKPNGRFIYDLAQWNGRHITWFPKHYLSQFHKKYNDKVEDLVKAEGVESWVALFNKKAAGPADDLQNFFHMPERPTLFAWSVKQPLGSGTTVTLERNPYYWKVDKEGNQLPYIDQVTGTSYQKSEARTFAMLNGELDYIKDTPGSDRALFFDAKDAGKPIKISSTISDGGTSNTIHFNRTVADAEKAKVFANKDFRIGMSHAINRQEIIDIVYQGQGEPSQAAPLKSSPFYHEKLATQYIEFNLDLANQALDKVLPKKDADGFRLGSDGKRFSAVFTVSNDLSYGTNWVQVAELLIGYWKKVGVEITLNSVPDKQFVEHRRLNQIEVTMYTGEGGAGLTPILDPRYYVPGELFGMYGIGWHYWRVKSETGTQVEPPQDVKDAMAQFQKVLTAPSAEAQIAEMKKVLDTAAENFWCIGIARPGSGFQPYHARLGNQPEEWIIGWIEGVQKLTYPEQWFIKE
jgi:peptide/nickel transport system substrate-binding protein